MNKYNYWMVVINLRDMYKPLRFGQLGQREIHTIRPEEKCSSKACVLWEKPTFSL